MASLAASTPSPCLGVFPAEMARGWSKCERMDPANNLSAVCSDSIVLDMTPPTCQIAIAAGVTYTNRSTVTLSLNSTDANGVNRMRFSNDGVTWANWQTYALTNTWNLPNPDGFKTVRAQFEDSAGNPSATCRTTSSLTRPRPQAL